MTIKQPRSTRLEKRIEELRSEIDAIIDGRVHELAGESPGVPAGVIRNLLTARAPSCRCAQYLELYGEKTES
jgi:hypothetical protein